MVFIGSFLSGRDGISEEFFVAIDQESSPDATEPKPLGQPVIENEIPTYRAVSTRAVFALICGALSFFSFTSPFFYLFAVLAVVLGVSADRSIQRRPEMLTGRGLARAGVAMGLIFGLSIATITTVQNYLIKREASRFAARYATMLKESPIADLYFVGLPPEIRESTTPEENLSKMAEAREEAAFNEMRYAPLKALNEFLKAEPGHTVSFVEIEGLGSEDLVPVALAVFKVEDSGDKDHEPEYAMAVIKGMVPEGKRGYEWWIDDVRYPYKPRSYVAPVQAVDDGHGHAH